MNDVTGKIMIAMERSMRVTRKVVRPVRLVASESVTKALSDALMAASSARLPIRLSQNRAMD